MDYVDKNTALKYLANSEKIFNRVKDSFLNTYKTGVEDITSLYSNKQFEDLYRYIHSIKGISLNVGSMILFEDSCTILDKIKKEEVTLPQLEQFIHTLRSVYFELQQL